MARCKGVTAAGNHCKNKPKGDSDFCIFHGGAEGRKSGYAEMDFAQGEVVRRKRTGFYQMVGRDGKLTERPRTNQLRVFEEYYESGGIVSVAIDNTVAVALGNGYQLVDKSTGSTESEIVDIIADLDDRINFIDMYEKIFRSLLIFGFIWGEMVIEGSDMIGLNFFPPYELEIDRDQHTGIITKYTQMRKGNAIASWTPQNNDRSDKNIDNIFFMTIGNLYSEAYGKSMIGKVYEEAEDRDTTRQNMTAISEFVAYPFRVVKVGNNEYPASEQGVTNVADQVEVLEPGDWLVTRHNVEFQFEAPKPPTAMKDMFEAQTRSLVVALGVPSLYTSFKDMDAQTLKEIRSIFNSRVRVLQANVKFSVEDMIFKRQLELKNIPVVREPHPVILAWNPLTVSVLSILELTQLIAVGAISIDESRRIIQSMGYGLLTGDAFKKEQAMRRREELALKNPKQTHPTDDDTDKKPNKGTQKETDKPKTKKSADTATVKKPQANSPKLGYDDWLRGVQALAEIDKNKAYNMLLDNLESGFTSPETD
jgi:hypothetical protein